MPDLKGSDNLYLVMAFVVPGLIISYVRSQYITGRSKSHTENVVAYVALSLLYYAITLPAIEYVLEMSGSRLAKAFAWLSLIIAGPAVVGLLLGWFTQRGIGRKIARKLGLNPVHTMPTAWDWKFADVGRGEGIYLIVTTQQDQKVAGWYGASPTGTTLHDKGLGSILCSQ